MKHCHHYTHTSWKGRKDNIVVLISRSLRPQQFSFIYFASFRSSLSSFPILRRFFFSFFSILSSLILIAVFSHHSCNLFSNFLIVLVFPFFFLSFLSVSFFSVFLSVVLYSFFSNSNRHLFSPFLQFIFEFSNCT